MYRRGGCKRCKAYKGGNELLYAMHQLELPRRQARLLVVQPSIDSARIAAVEGSFPYPAPLTGYEKSILAGIPARARFRPTYANVLLSSEVFLNEPGCLAPDKPAARVLESFAAAVRGIIETFP
jgi:hypothetical protein